MKKIAEFCRWSDGRRTVEITSREDMAIFRGQIVYNSYPYAITYNSRREIKVHFVSGADIQKAARIGASNIPMRKIKKHLVAARMALHLEKSDVTNIMTQLKLIRLTLN